MDRRSCVIARRSRGDPGALSVGNEFQHGNLAGFDLCVGAAASRYSQGDAKKHGSRRKHSENKGVSHRSSFGSTCRPLARKRDYARPSPERMLATRREYREGIRFFSSRKFPRLIDKPAKAAEEVASSTRKGETRPRIDGFEIEMVLLDRIELSTSSLPMTRSTTELQQQPDRPPTHVRWAGAAYGGASLACQDARLDDAAISRAWPLL